MNNTIPRHILSYRYSTIRTTVTYKYMSFIFCLYFCYYATFFFCIIYAERLHNELRDRSRVEIWYKTLVKLDPVPWILDVYASPQNTERATKLAKMWKKSIIILVNILKYSTWNRLSRISHTYPILNTDINVL